MEHFLLSLRYSVQELVGTNFTVPSVDLLQTDYFYSNICHSFLLCKLCNVLVIKYCQVHESLVERCSVIDIFVVYSIGCVTDFQVLQVNRLFAITYSVDYAFSRIAGYRFQNFL